MPEPKRPLKVFLCHAHADRDPVRGLYTRLTQDGVDAWLDKAKLLPGHDWELEIRKAVREADVVVVCLSKQFNQAGFRQKEVRLALDTAMEKPEGEIFIIPARLEECDNLESLRKWHWVDLFEDDGYEMLIRALRARADKIGAILQVRKSWQQSFSQQQFDKTNKKDHTPSKLVSVLRRKVNLKIISYFFVFIGLVGAILIGYSWINQAASRSEVDETSYPLMLTGPTQSSGDMLSMFATGTANARTPNPMEMIEIFATQTAEASLPVEITDAKGVSMVLVPAGVFLMGSDEFEDSEKPVHTVGMPDYYIDKYEATNKFYKDCVDAGWCIPPVKSSSATRPSYYEDPEFSDYPVGYINWNMARSYCEWRGARLPTEAEWEKAARGSGGRVYPWGNALNCDYANYQGCNKDTTKVGSYESGKSPYGVYDMAGNVWEWVNDWYDEKYYLTLGDNSFNPLGPTEGDARVLHGGAWYYINGPNVRSSLRGWESPDVWDLLFGVRCARSIP